MLLSCVCVDNNMNPKSAQNKKTVREILECNAFLLIVGHGAYRATGSEPLAIVRVGHGVHGVLVAPQRLQLVGLEQSIYQGHLHHLHTATKRSSTKCA